LIIIYFEIIEKLRNNNRKVEIIQKRFIFHNLFLILVYANISLFFYCIYVLIYKLVVDLIKKIINVLKFKFFEIRLAEKRNERNYQLKSKRSSISILLLINNIFKVYLRTSVTFFMTAAV